MSELDVIAGRLKDAEGTPGVLAAAWDALAYLCEATTAAVGAGPQWYAAYMFAAAAAAEARDAAGMAPSMPALGPPGPEPAADEEPPARLAGLAAAAAARLSAAAGQAGPGDRAALRRAAAGAGQVRQFLAGNE